MNKASHQKTVTQNHNLNQRASGSSPKYHPYSVVFWVVGLLGTAIAWALASHGGKSIALVVFFVVTVVAFLISHWYSIDFGENLRFRSDGLYHNKKFLRWNEIQSVSFDIYDQTDANIVLLLKNGNSHRIYDQNSDLTLSEIEDLINKRINQNEKSG